MVVNIGTCSVLWTPNRKEKKVKKKRNLISSENRKLPRRKIKEDDAILISPERARHTGKKIYTEYTLHTHTHII